jgi:cell wall-associated NlpC family hydrolase
MGAEEAIIPRWIAVVLATASCVLGAGLGLAAPPASAETRGEAIVQEAKKWEGHPYCFDGGNENEPTLGKEDPENGLRCGYDPSDTPGFDCRGLALYAVYQGTDHAVKLPISSAQEQYSNASSYGGSYISDTSMQPGDLAFFGYSTSHDIQHVGIVVSRTGESAEIVSAISEQYGIATHTIHWFKDQFTWVGAVAIPGVGNQGGGGSSPSIASVSSSVTFNG